MGQTVKREKVGRTVPSKDSESLHKLWASQVGLQLNSSLTEKFENIGHSTKIVPD